MISMYIDPIKDIVVTFNNCKALDLHYDPYIVLHMLTDLRLLSSCYLHIYTLQQSDFHCNPNALNFSAAVKTNFDFCLGHFDLRRFGW